MEYLGEEVGQQGGRRCLYIVGGTIQPLPPHSAPQTAVLPLGWAILPLSKRYCRSTLAVLPCKGAGTQSGTTVEAGRYYRWKRYYRHYYRF